MISDNPVSIFSVVVKLEGLNQFFGNGIHKKTWESSSQTKQASEAGILRNKYK